MKTQFKDINGKTLKIGDYFYMEETSVLENENPSEPTHYLNWDDLILHANIYEVKKVDGKFQPNLEHVEEGNYMSLIELEDWEFVIL